MTLGAGASAEQLADYLHVQEAAVAPAPRSREALAPTAGALLRAGHEVWGRVRPA
jgi:hypothetical protein